MSKNTLYLIATLLAVVIIALVMSPKNTNHTATTQPTIPAALPSNGLTGGTTSDAAVTPSVTVPSNVTEPSEVPASAEVAPAPAPTPSVPQPVDSGLAVPATER